ncbi:predicted protein [Naegleria gruberi]|uniref:Predicted protein n=1 Tax=Naegleria gruberi TaxID=5762 RepID=D2V5I1_NAEGR|nr:uncharacterized protein NAEGRDRAFT_31268 [Naegleria gruberi]EFC47654.1 predicted protein [Naegleria gruberi]|eukprot:XP_002680398.1 predicted protein [Naegleria gruberi strain NEG-M]
MNDPVIVDYRKVFEDNPKKSEDHGNTIDLSKESQFDQIIAKNPIVVVDYYATWCGPCMMLAPAMAQLSMDYPTVKIVKIDVDKFPTLAQRGKVRAMPTIVYYYKQKEVKRHEGGSKGSIDASIATLLAKK